MGWIRYALALALTPACAPMLPVARPTTPPRDAQVVQEATWQSLGGQGSAPEVIYVRPDCDAGLQDYNGLGCVGGEVISARAGTGWTRRVYVARIGDWRRILRHEYRHYLSGDPGHESKKWWFTDRNGDIHAY